MAATGANTQALCDTLTRLQDGWCPVGSEELGSTVCLFGGQRHSTRFPRGGEG